MEQLESQPNRPEYGFTFAERIRDLSVTLAQIKETRQDILKELAEAQEMFDIIGEEVKQRTAAGTLTSSLLQLLELADKNINDLARMVLQANEFEDKIGQVSEALSDQVERIRAQLLDITPERLS